MAFFWSANALSAGKPMRLSTVLRSVPVPVSDRFATACHGRRSAMVAPQRKSPWGTVNGKFQSKMESSTPGTLAAAKRASGLSSD